MRQIKPPKTKPVTKPGKVRKIPKSKVVKTPKIDPVKKVKTPKLIHKGDFGS